MRVSFEGKVTEVRTDGEDTNVRFSEISFPRPTSNPDKNSIWQQNLVVLGELPLGTRVTVTVETPETITQKGEEKAKKDFTTS